MRNARLDEAQEGIKTAIAGRNINNPRFADDTKFMVENENKTKQNKRTTTQPLDESERGERKSWLKAQHSEN